MFVTTRFDGDQILLVTSGEEIVSIRIHNIRVHDDRSISAEFGIDAPEGVIIDVQQRRPVRADGGRPRTTLPIVPRNRI